MIGSELSLVRGTKAPSSSGRKKQPFVEYSTPFLPAAFEATDIFGSVRSLGYWARREANLQRQLLKGPGWRRVCRERQRPGPAHPEFQAAAGVWSAVLRPEHTVCV